MLLFVFDGGTLTDSEVAALRPDGDEIAETRYWPAGDLDDLAPARLVNRLRLALTALQTGQTLYAERGTSPVAA